MIDKQALKCALEGTGHAIKMLALVTLAMLGFMGAMLLLMMGVVYVMNYLKDLFPILAQPISLTSNQVGWIMFIVAILIIIWTIYTDVRTRYKKCKNKKV